MAEGMLPLAQGYHRSDLISSSERTGPRHGARAEIRVRRQGRCASGLSQSPAPEGRAGPSPAANPTRPARGTSTWKKVPRSRPEGRPPPRFCRGPQAADPPPQAAAYRFVAAEVERLLSSSQKLGVEGRHRDAGAGSGKKTSPGTLSRAPRPLSHAQPNSSRRARAHPQPRFSSSPSSQTHAARSRVGDGGEGLWGRARRAACCVSARDSSSSGPSPRPLHPYLYRRRRSRALCRRRRRCRYRRRPGSPEGAVTGCGDSAAQAQHRARSRRHTRTSRAEPAGQL
ncbi:uncharacterized protein [Notamacropus eugenii]|uniref:uncharacterized protein n=1 Tax=Notamacropus eugenii TaxID=9315 RepID=UPI003B684034